MLLGVYLYVKAPNCTTWYTVFYFLSVTGSSLIGNIVKRVSDSFTNNKSLVSKEI